MTVDRKWIKWNNYHFVFGSETKKFHDTVAPLAKSQEELPARRMFDSYDEIIIPLKENIVKREEYYNAFHKVRFGRLLEDLDMFAGACRYCIV